MVSLSTKFQTNKLKTSSRPRSRILFSVTKVRDSITAARLCSRRNPPPLPRHLLKRRSRHHPTLLPLDFVNSDSILSRIPPRFHCSTPPPLRNGAVLFVADTSQGFQDTLASTVFFAVLPTNIGLASICLPIFLVWHYHISFYIFYFYPLLSCLSCHSNIQPKNQLGISADFFSIYFVLEFLCHTSSRVATLTGEH